MDKLLGALLSEEFIDGLLENEYFIEQLQIKLAGGSIRSKTLSYGEFIDLTEQEIIHRFNNEDIEKYDNYIARMCNENRLIPSYFNLAYNKSLHIIRLLTNRNCKINNIFENNRGKSIAYAIIENCCNKNYNESVKRLIDFERIALLVPNISGVSFPLSPTDFYYLMKDGECGKYSIFKTLYFDIDYTKNLIIDENLIFRYLYPEYLSYGQAPTFSFDDFINCHKKYNHPPIPHYIVTGLFRKKSGCWEIKNVFVNNAFISCTSLKFDRFEIIINEICIPTREPIVEELKKLMKLLKDKY